jgi:high-affinity iron transporter
VDQPVYSAGGGGLAAGAIRAFHEAGLWNHFQDVAFDLSNVLSTHSLTGTLLEGIFGYQETPSVSEVAMYFIYLVPALVLFACRRVPARRRRALRRNF